MKQRLLALINRFYKRERDPQRMQRTLREYDIGRGYERYHTLCRAQLARPVADGGHRLLNARGFDYLDVLEPAAAAALIDSVAASHRLDGIRQGSKSHFQRLTDIRLLEPLLARLFTAELDAALKHFFQSEYLVHWLTFSVARKTAQQDLVSFSWHCDKGPTQHLKLIVYLNASSEHGGNTEFIDLDDTRSVGERGYVFGWTKTRTSDVGHLEALAGRPIVTHKKELRAGEGILFQPAQVLHRGLSPLRGDRYALTLNLLPSPMPWRAALHKDTLSALAADKNWHDHVDELLQALQARHS